MHRNKRLNPRLECSTSDSECPALGLPVHADPFRIDLVHTHQNSNRLHSIQEHVPVIEIIRIWIIQSANDMAADRGSFHIQIILGQATLPPAIKCQDRKAMCSVGRLLQPVPTVTGIPVKNSKSRTFPARLLSWSRHLAVNPRPAYTREI
ncbi:hypothetical protein D3C81_1423520 [compost metagenome]